MGDHMIGAGGVWLRWVGQILFVAFLLAVVALAGRPSPVAQALAVGGVIIAFAHGVFVYGWSGILLFLSICLTVTFATENLSIATGFPFGHYHFEVAAALPHVGAVPVIVGLLYFAMGYFSWMIASLLLDDADFHLDRPLNVVALPIIASFVMVQWDVVMDPPNATLSRAWIWHNGGGYFGVPLSNYAGWYLTVWLFYQVFALAIYFRPSLVRRRSHGSSLVPMLVYLAVALSNAVPYLIGRDGEVIDATGHVWRLQDLRETTVVVMLFTMLFTSALALSRWAARKGLRYAIGTPPSQPRVAKEDQRNADMPLATSGACRRSQMN
jgi:putative membrane protein